MSFRWLFRRKMWFFFQFFHIFCLNIRGNFCMDTLYKKQAKGMALSWTLLLSSIFKNSCSKLHVFLWTLNPSFATWEASFLGHPAFWGYIYLAQQLSGGGGSTPIHLSRGFSPSFLMGSDPASWDIQLSGTLKTSFLVPLLDLGFFRGGGNGSSFWDASSFWLKQLSAIPAFRAYQLSEHIVFPGKFVNSSIIPSFWAYQLSMQIWK